MKLLFLRPGALTLFVVALMGLDAHQSQAQTKPLVTPLGEGRFDVRLETAATPLSAVLEALYQAGGNPQHVVDAAANTIAARPVTILNSDWHSAVREMAERNGFAMRDENRTCFVERKTALVEVAPASPSRVPNAPSTPSSEAGDLGLPRGVFGRAAAQTVPNIGGASSSTSTADQQIIPIYVRHIYVGGIAQLFQNSGIIGTQAFVSPLSSGGFGGSRGGQGGGRNSFGGGGFGGNSFGGGGFGGNSFGGNSFGGNSFGGGGGFGGNNFGGGGFGGNSFGGGGFGGNSFGGGGGFGGNNFGGGGFGF